MESNRKALAADSLFAIVNSLWTAFAQFNSPAQSSATALITHDQSQQIPNEILNTIVLSIAIFKPGELASLMFVSKHFYALINKDDVWNTFGFNQKDYRNHLKINAIAKQYGTGTALAVNAKRALTECLPGSLPCLKVLIVGNGNNGYALEKAILKSNSTINDFQLHLCRSSSKAQLRSEFERDGRCGGAQIALLCFNEKIKSDINCGEKALFDCWVKENCSNPILDGKLLFIAPDSESPSLEFDVDFFFKRLSKHYPEIAERIAGTLNLEWEPTMLRDAFITQILPMIDTKARAYELPCTSRSWYAMFQSHQQNPSEHLPAPSNEKCSIM